MNNTASSCILSTGYYLPASEIKTSDMLGEIGADRFGVESNYIEQSVGVERVRHSGYSQKPSDLAISACRSAIETASINVNLIDLIVFCGIEGDYTEPSTAHFIQSKLGLKSKICFDVQNACMGFMTGLQIADSMIASGAVRYALVCTGERPSIVSKSAIKELRKTSDIECFKNKIGMLTVGDAGGAMVVGPKNQGGFMNFGVSSDGQYAKLCYYKPKNNGLVDGQMLMGRICAAVINAHKKLYWQTLDDSNWTPSDIDCLIMHQAGKRPFDTLTKAFSIDPVKAVRTYHCYGNMTSATFPVALGLAIEQGMVNKKSKIWAAMAGSGISVSHAGFTLQ